ncbi:aldehyde dehydrogenase (NADP(+)) [Marinomonas epiphytica]
MQLTGQQLIGQSSYTSSGAPIWATNPADGEQLQPCYLGGGSEEVKLACDLAELASRPFRNTSLEVRASFLETIASEIESLGESLVIRCMEETGLPQARIEGERARTCGQLRLFAQVVRSGEWLGVRIDPALPERQPLPRADLRYHKIAIGPVAVFGASNFPLAFSVAGGDSAAALAAGCPVVVKAHSAHPGTAELVGKAIQNAVSACNLPEGVFSLLYGSGNTLGQALVTDPRIKAVGFTGSRAGGTALMKLAQNRAEPIPVYAEMSSINPVYLLPSALANRSKELAESFISSLTMGAGQFCTNPGLILSIKGGDLDVFLDYAKKAIESSAAQTMLTPGIYTAYQNGVLSLRNNDKVRCVGTGLTGTQENACQASLFVTKAEHFLKDERLTEEVFGASSLIVECEDVAQLKLLTSKLEGQLTATLHMDTDDSETARSLLPYLEEKAGRIMVNNWPTGVEVCHAMVHGGPFPATSDVRTTSVGSSAIDRFLRPVCYQSIPEELLPEDLKTGSDINIPQLIDGKRQ